MRLSGDPSGSSTGSYVPFSRGSHKQKQCQERTSLRSWGVQRRALQLQVSEPGYSAQTWRHEHKPQVPQRWPQERDAEWLAPTNTRHTHCAPRQLGTTANRRYDVPRDWLWDACHMAGVCWGSRCEGFRSDKGPHYRIEQSARNPPERDQVQIALGNHPEAVIGQVTINLIHKFGNPLRIPYPSCTCYLAGIMSREKVELKDFVSKKGTICVRLTDVCRRNLRQKAEKGKITKDKTTTGLLWASCFKNPTRSVPEKWGRKYNVLPWSAKGMRKQDEKSNSCAAEKGATKLVSSDFAKILG
jgi:hypothetical protein